MSKNQQIFFFQFNISSHGEMSLMSKSFTLFCQQGFKIFMKLLARVNLFYELIWSSLHRITMPDIRTFSFSMRIAVFV